MLEQTIILTELALSLTIPTPQSLKGRCEHHSVCSVLKPVSLVFVGDEA